MTYLAGLVAVLLVAQGSLEFRRVRVDPPSPATVLEVVTRS